MTYELRTVTGQGLPDEDARVRMLLSDGWEPFARVATPGLERWEMDFRRMVGVELTVRMDEVRTAPTIGGGKKKGR